MGYKIGYCKPPTETRFPVNRKDHTQKGPHLTTILKKLLSAKWPIKDRQIKQLLKVLKLPETLETSVVLRRLLNACEGDDLAIERIFDRIDGKLKTNGHPLVDQSTHYHIDLNDAELINEARKAGLNLPPAIKGRIGETNSQ